MPGGSGAPVVVGLTVGTTVGAGVGEKDGKPVSDGVAVVGASVG